MPADLRTKLKALVGELHQQAALYRRGQEISDERQALAYTQCARKLAALLAESEPERECSPGVPYIPARTSGDAWSLEPAEAKLPLGHEFVPHTNGPERDCTLYQKCHYIGGPGLCGQPRSAHEPR